MAKRWERNEDRLIALIDKGQDVNKPTSKTSKTKSTVMASAAFNALFFAR